MTVSESSDKRVPISLYLCPLTPLDGMSAHATRLRRWLPDDERVKVDRYLQQTARDKGLLVRGYLRLLLSRYSQEIGTAVAPQAWRFDYLDKGKPVLSRRDFERTNVLFNLSHSGNYLMLAMTQGEQSTALGVDIERQRASTNIHGILNHYFTPCERDALLALPESLQRQRFFDLWALKESYIKAKGQGLSLSLKSFSFELANEQEQALPFQGRSCLPVSLKRDIELFLHQEQRSLASHWQSVLGRIGTDYRFAVSLASEHTMAIELKWVVLEELFVAAREQ